MLTRQLAAFAVVMQVVEFIAMNEFGLGVWQASVLFRNVLYFTPLLMPDVGPVVVQILYCLSFSLLMKRNASGE